MTLASQGSQWVEWAPGHSFPGANQCCAQLRTSIPGLLLFDATTAHRLGPRVSRDYIAVLAREFVNVTYIQALKMTPAERVMSNLLHPAPSLPIERICSADEGRA